MMHKADVFACYLTWDTWVVFPAGYIWRPLDRMKSDAPATLDVAVVLPVGSNHPSDEDEFTNV